MRSPREFTVLIESGELALTHWLRHICSKHNLTDSELALVLYGLSLRHTSWRPLAQDDLNGELVQSDCVLEFLGTKGHLAIVTRSMSLSIDRARYQLMRRILSHVFQAHLRAKTPRH